ncbi:MAG: FAD:protein FMN transferase, partial [Leptospiraceae bacterium]|nr:FAD:protein FMN transferase [Leptospiraceae bacterium]
IATSSSGEKFKFTGKKRFSHIFDTSQNQFRNGLFSVSVFHSDAIAADALSTAIAARPSLAPEIVLTDPEIIIVILDEDTISSFSRKNSFISEYKKSSNRS